MALRLSALRIRRTLLPTKHYYFYVCGTHFCWRLSKPQGLVRAEGLDKFKNLPHRVLNPRLSGL
jgi:hypothetical protein